MDPLKAKRFTRLEAEGIQVCGLVGLKCLGVTILMISYKKFLLIEDYLLKGLVLVESEL